MHLVINKSKHGKKIYNSILLRESYRENGKVKKRTIANLSNCSKEEIEAIKLALKHKNELVFLKNIFQDMKLKQGRSIGAVWLLYMLSQRLQISKALGSSFEGKLALWQVISRVYSQGSRLQSVRMAREYASVEILDIKRDFNEEHLYKNLEWIAKNQTKIEDKLYKLRNNGKGLKLFLYDVTSSYLEGENNYFSDYGYNRDGKKGKKQIVIGLLCDETGVPLSVDVYKGNTSDVKTLLNQVDKAAKRFNCEEVIMVGDRGMLKQTNISELPNNFHYITGITKREIESLIKRGAFRLALFDENLYEVEYEGLRYILRKNPVIEYEKKIRRLQKLRALLRKVNNQNRYLSEHPRARLDVASRKIEEYMIKLGISDWNKLLVLKDLRKIEISIDREKYREIGKLDGCYVLKTDVKKEIADKELIHSRYKDLSKVEYAFKELKSELEIRPLYVRNELSTRAHVFICMLSYMLLQELEKSWKGLDIRVSEGLSILSKICTQEVILDGKSVCVKIPEATGIGKNLLKSAGIKLPSVLPPREANVDTRKKISKE